jgi:hypothetical protein
MAERVIGWNSGDDISLHWRNFHDEFVSFY